MGNASSKAAKNASKLSSSSAARKYPPPNPNRTNVQAERPRPGATAGPTVHPQTQISQTRDQAIDHDSSDPDLELNARARKLGPVVPNPTLSNSSTFNQAHGHLSPSSISQTVFPSRSAPQNAAVTLLEARERLAAEAEEEFVNVGRKGAGGRHFLDVYTVRQVLQMREKGTGNEEIEGKLGLKTGTVSVLGGKDVVGLAAVV